MVGGGAVSLDPGATDQGAGTRRMAMTSWRHELLVAPRPAGGQPAAARRRPVAALWLRALERISPEAAARRGEELLLAPPRAPLSEAERGVLALARCESVPFAGAHLPVWIWAGASYRPPTIFLIHDWGGRGADLAAFVAPLRAEGARVIAFDAPAHGQAPGRRTDVVEFASAVRRVLERHSEWSRPRGIVAHSLGAAAATIALAGGTGAERVVYLAAAENLDPYVDRFRRELGLSAALVGNVRRRVDRRFGLFRESLRGRTLARALALPLLAFHDADDCEIPAAHSETIVARWAGARLVRTIGLGHRGLLRHEGVVRAAVEHLLSDATAAPEASHPGDG